MDRKSQQRMAQIVLEIGQDSLRQYLFQNTLHLSMRSHQKSILSNHNTSNLLINPLRGRFLFLSKPANLKNKESWGGGVTVNWYHVSCIRSHLLGIWCLCRRRHMGSFLQRGVRTSTPFCYSSSRCHEMAARTYQNWRVVGTARHSNAELTKTVFYRPLQVTLAARGWHRSQLPHRTLQINNGFRIFTPWAARVRGVSAIIWI